MSFVDGFYGFSLNLSVPERSVYTRLRFKTPKHPNESSAELGARVLTFLHTYRDGSSLSSGLFDPDSPDANAADVTGRVLLWAHAGSPDPKQLRLALKHAPEAEFCVYFRAPAEIDVFCHHLRGSKENWVAPIRFFLFDPAQLDTIGSVLGSSNSGDATITEERIFLDLNGQGFDLSVEPVDVWHNFQRTIQNRA